MNESNLRNLIGLGCIGLACMLIGGLLFLVKIQGTAITVLGGVLVVLSLVLLGIEVTKRRGD